ncbi:hypothetical protein [Saccharothrix australiensis]|uniref:Uncharacterized protein n=1 Tax=Saccharothrix australiensis TaxID=2072 RepID=A0A495W942_9PSEU|nr:hypothetical protein [Saccharothrix australiensis]RKT57193.1 hypothetical protein C8E97_5911 [Saccharothrix australiensis]
MQPWLYAVLFCALLLAIGVVVDRRARAERAGLVRPADTAGRSRAEPVAQARIDHPGAAGITERVDGRTP